MDESWRRRRPAIQPSQATDHLGPDDFRDVFGGPPRSVLLRHFSPSTQHADGSSLKRDYCKGNPPYSTVSNSCEPEFVSTIRCGRGGFSITRREPEMANRSVFSKEEHPSLIPVFHKDGLPATICDDCTSFRVIERDDGSSYDTMSDFHTPAHIVRNGYQDINCEVADTCFEDAFVYRPVSSGRHPTTWGVSSDAFPAIRREDVFYSDIFGSVLGKGSNAGSRRSRSVSKCESESTAVSCCEEGLLANSVYGYEGDAVFSSYASKLRPITIPSKHYDLTPPSTISEGDGHNTLRYAGTARPSSPLTYTRDGASSRNSNNLNTKNKNRCAASSFCCFTPPETLSLDPSFRRSFKKMTSPEDNSPPSVISLSVPHKAREVEKKVVLEVFDHVKSEEELNFGSEVSAALDEAIAWAKERFTTQDDTVDHKNDNFVGFKDWNGTEGKDYAYSKER